MAEIERKKDSWDKIAAATPLFLGLAVTFVGILFTNAYNARQLQLNQITALRNLQPLLTSDKPEEREFGYASFAALGYEGMAIRIIKMKQDESGRQVLVQLTKGGSKENQARAHDAIKTLDETPLSDPYAGDNSSLLLEMTMAISDIAHVEQNYPTYLEVLTGPNSMSRENAKNNLAELKSEYFVAAGRAAVLVQSMCFRMKIRPPQPQPSILSNKNLDRSKVDVGRISVVRRYLDELVTRFRASNPA